MGKEVFYLKTEHSIFRWKSESLAHTKTMTGLALFTALYVLLNALTIQISPTLRISFSFVALAISCRRYGFWPNVILCMAADFLGYMVHPDGVYVPFFALILVVKAFIYTQLFYGKKQVGLWQVLLAQFLADGIGNVLLNPLLLSVMYQMPYWVLVTSRLLKNACCYPFECLALFAVLRLAFDRSQASKMHAKSR